MSHTCPECGAILDDENTCQAIFETLLALEYSDPGYGQVHFLTVACFMIQHRRYSDEALAWIQPLVRSYLEDGLPGDRLRRLAAQDTSSHTRSWKVLRAAGAPPLPKVAWTMTIAEVTSQYRDARSYQELVRQWAHITLKQMEQRR